MTNSEYLGTIRGYSPPTGDITKFVDLNSALVSKPMTKQLNFVATKAGVDENDDCLVAALDSGADEYIMFQRSPEFGSQDDDGIYVEINSQIHASYDSVFACSATDSALTLYLTTPLDGFTEIHAVLSVSPENVHKFYCMLRRIFTGHESLLQIKLPDALR